MGELVRLWRIKPTGNDPVEFIIEHLPWFVRYMWMNRFQVQGFEFKGYNRWTVLTIRIKIRNGRHNPLCKTDDHDEHKILLITAD